MVPDKESIKKATRMQGCGMRADYCSETIGNVRIDMAISSIDMRVWEEDVNKQIKDAILKNHKHNFIKANDGTYDKVCVICGIRAKQAVMKF